MGVYEYVNRWDGGATATATALFICRSAGSGGAVSLGSSDSREAMDEGGMYGEEGDGVGAVKSVVCSQMWWVDMSK